MILMVYAPYILLTGLSHAGACVDVDIIDRMKDGYGISRELIDLAKERNRYHCDLRQWYQRHRADCLCKSLGMTVLVTDHHEVPYEEQEDGSIRTFLRMQMPLSIPNRRTAVIHSRESAEAMVKHKVIWGLYEKLGISFSELEELIPLQPLPQ